MSSGRILIADDEPSVRDSVGYALTQEGFEVTPAEPTATRRRRCSATASPTTC